MAGADFNLHYMYKLQAIGKNYARFATGAL